MFELYALNTTLGQYNEYILYPSWIFLHIVDNGVNGLLKYLSTGVVETFTAFIPTRALRPCSCHFGSSELASGRHEQAEELRVTAISKCRRIPSSEPVHGSSSEVSSAPGAG